MTWAWPYAAATVFAALLLPATSAIAHGPISGVNEFYDGALHTLYAPAHLFCVLALGLRLGQRWHTEVPYAVAAFLAALGVGLTAGLHAPPGDLATVLLAGSAVLGLLIAAQRPLPTGVHTLLAATAGLALGLDCGREAARTTNPWMILAGNGVGIVLPYCYALAFADGFNKRHWQRVGVRILGSWISASALLILALSMGAVSKTTPG